MVSLRECSTRGGATKHDAAGVEHNRRRFFFIHKAFLSFEKIRKNIPLRQVTTLLHVHI